jgi:hypothetical protein
MKNDARTSSAMFMSLLDLVSCALGASIILAVVFSVIENPIPSPKVDDFISAEFIANNNVQLGVVLYHEKTGEQINLTPEALHYKKTRESIIDDYKLAGDVSWFSAKNDGQAIFTVNIDKPQKGKWLIAPYIYSYANNLVKSKVETISVRWRNKSSIKDIYCTNEDVKSDRNFNPDSINRQSSSGALSKGVINKHCIQGAEDQKFAVIAHEFT